MNKKYTIVRSSEPRKSGRHYLIIRLPDNTNPPNPWDLIDLKEEAEKQFFEDLIEVIENCLFLKKNSKLSGTIETLVLYETSEGVIVEVVQDDFDGLMVESEDKDIIEKIYQRLLKM